MPLPPRAPVSMRVGLAATAIGLAWIALFWPGIVTFDGVVQYGQALSGHLDDWHPPIMALLWRALLKLGLAGSGPLFAAQTALFFAGLGLVGAALARAGHRGAAAGTLTLAAFPPLASWMTVVVKDAQMVACLTAATGIVAHYRLGARPVPRPAAAAAALLFAYALLVRANAAFGAVPLALALAHWGRLRRPLARVAAVLAGIAAVIAVSGPINHALLGAERSHVERTLPLFDLAGIAHEARLSAPPRLEPERWAAAEANGCYTPVLWDPLGDPKRCDAIADTLTDDPDRGMPSIERAWIGQIAAHPFAYVAHRLHHAVSTLRLLPPPLKQAPAAAPAKSHPNRWRIGQPARSGTAWLRSITDAADETPLGAPALWLLASLLLLPLLGAAPPQPARALGLGLCWSAIGTEAGLLLVGIASDLRYHLWTALAAGLATVMLASCDGAPRGWAKRLLLALAFGALAILMLRAAAPASWTLRA